MLSKSRDDSLLSTAAISSLASLLLISAGCSRGGPGLVDVSGKVVVDEQPVEAAFVMFMPDAKGRPSWGRTDANGEFQLTTFRDSDGAAIGSYRVTVSKIIQKGKGPTKKHQSIQAEIEAELSAKGKNSDEIWILPHRYANPKTSELAFTVESSGENYFVLQLSGT